MIGGRQCIARASRCACRAAGGETAVGRSGAVRVPDQARCAHAAWLAAVTPVRRSEQDPCCRACRGCETTSGQGGAGTPLGTICGLSCYGSTSRVRLPCTCDRSRPWKLKPWQHRRQGRVALMHSFVRQRTHPTSRLNCGSTRPWSVTSRYVRSLCFPRHTLVHARVCGPLSACRRSWQSCSALTGNYSMCRPTWLAASCKKV